MILLNYYLIKKDYMKLKFFLLFYTLLLVELQCTSLEKFLTQNQIINELTTEEYITIIRPFLPEDPILLEAGSHGGQDSVALAKSWPKGTLLAFEPVQKFVEYTQKSLIDHKINNARVMPYALSPINGRQTFYYSNTIGAASSLLPNNGLCDYQDTVIEVECVNLDDWARKNNINHIDFMWLDIEGSELHVLKSCPTILKTVQVIITEVNFKEFRKDSTQCIDLCNFLTKNGFHLYKIWGSPTWQGTALFIRSELIH